MPTSPSRLRQGYRHCLSAALAAVRSIGPPVDQEYGERSAGVKDPSVMSGTSHSEGEHQSGRLRTVKCTSIRCVAEPVIRFMERALGAQGSRSTQRPDALCIMRASQLATRGGDGRSARPVSNDATMFYLYLRTLTLVPPCSRSRSDVVTEPADQPYGDRTPREDPFRQSVVSCDRQFRKPIGPNDFRRNCFGHGGGCRERPMGSSAIPGHQPGMSHQAGLVFPRSRSA